jgi:hypothetical protein
VQVCKIRIRVLFLLSDWSFITISDRTCPCRVLSCRVLSCLVLFCFVLPQLSLWRVHPFFFDFGSALVHPFLNLTA